MTDELWIITTLKGKIKMSEQTMLVRNKEITGASNIKAFYIRYTTQLNKIQVKGIYIDDEYLWKRFCKLSRVPKKIYKWTSQDTHDMNIMTDGELCRAIVKASGSILQEMR